MFVLRHTYAISILELEANVALARLTAIVPCPAVTPLGTPQSAFGLFRTVASGGANKSGQALTLQQSSIFTQTLNIIYNEN